MSTAIHLALKEIWRNRGRFLLFSLVVALTVLILSIEEAVEGNLALWGQFLPGNEIPRPFAPRE